VYERFTERARHAVRLADLACRELGHQNVDTEHLLLGVLQDEGTAHHVLRAMGATSDAARATIIELFGKGEGTPEGQLRYAADAHAALEVALRESIGFRHERVGTEHLLLGLLRQSSSRAVAVLAALRVDPNSVRERVLDLIGTPGFTSPELASYAPSRTPAPGTADTTIDVSALAVEVARLRNEVAQLRAEVQRLAERGGEG
jgi:ATP-dependent Clp protease ATP-binding subunit ClpC